MKKERTFISRTKEGVWKYWLAYHWDGSSYISAVTRIK